MQARASERERPPCTFEGCRGRRHHRSGLCASHELQRVRGEDLRPLQYKRKPGEARTCSYPGCDRDYQCAGYCKRHAEHYYRYGAPRDIGTYRTGWTNKQGYRIIHRPGHPNARTNGQVAEHTVVMSEVLGRGLLPGENVHHINGVRDDNRPENLELWVVSQPSGQRVADVVAWAREILDRYA